MADRVGADRRLARDRSSISCRAKAALTALPTCDTVVLERSSTNREAAAFVHARGDAYQRAWVLALRSVLPQSIRVAGSRNRNATCCVASATVFRSPRRAYLSPSRAAVRCRPARRPRFATRWREAGFAWRSALFAVDTKSTPVQRWRSEIAGSISRTSACGERRGDRAIPVTAGAADDRDCLHEAMDIDRVERVLCAIERGRSCAGARSHDRHHSRSKFSPRVPYPYLDAPTRSKSAVTGGARAPRATETTAISASRRQGNRRVREEWGPSRTRRQRTMRDERGFLAWEIDAQPTGALLEELAAAKRATRIAHAANGAHVAIVVAAERLPSSTRCFPRSAGSGIGSESV